MVEVRGVTTGTQLGIRDGDSRRDPKSVSK
jgi:hypothetical protein